MKKYKTMERTSRIEAVQNTYEALLLFQFMLRNSETLDQMYHGKAQGIADGLQPWIDALKLRMQHSSKE